jgi:hypothetical protein
MAECPTMRRRETETRRTALLLDSYRRRIDEFSGYAAIRPMTRQKPAITSRADVLELLLALLA